MKKIAFCMLLVFCCLVSFAACEKKPVYAEGEMPMEVTFIQNGELTCLAAITNSTGVAGIYNKQSSFAFQTLREGEWQDVDCAFTRSVYPAISIKEDVTYREYLDIADPAVFAPDARYRLLCTIEGGAFAAAEFTAADIPTEESTTLKLPMTLSFENRAEEGAPANRISYHVENTSTETITNHYYLKIQKSENGKWVNVDISYTMTELLFGAKSGSTFHDDIGLLDATQFDATAQYRLLLKWTNGLYAVAEFSGSDVTGR